MREAHVRLVSTKRLLKYSKIGLVVFLTGVIFEVWIVNQLSVYGNKIEEINRLISSLRLENAILESTLAENSSLNLVNKKAEEYGFGEVKHIEYIK